MKQNICNKSIFVFASVITLVFGSSCISDKDTKNINSRNKKMSFISHRGESYDAPENTLKAFRLAWQRNTDGIELDIHMTADEKIVCIHDADTGRVGNKKLVVAKETYEALCQVDVGDGERIPLLSEVLGESPVGKAIYIEIKTGPEILPALQKLIKNFPAKIQDLRIISFNDNSLKEAKKIFPDIAMYILRAVSWNSKENRFEPDAEKLIALQKEMRVDGFDLQASSEINEGFLAALRENNSKIVVWTIDDIAKAKKFKSLGVDVITSNRAAYLKTHMEQ
jgi:glycerophosphoryl diester phosphodiesterase